MATNDTTLEAVAVAGDVAAALDAANPAAEILDNSATAADLLVVARRVDAEVKLVDLEPYQPHPHRPRGSAQAFTAQGFVDALLHRSADTDRVTVYADPDTCQLTAVLNDDEDGEAGWRDHRIELALKPTPEWLLWTNNEGLGDQAKFARVIEEGEDEIREPSATVMLEIAQTFHASTSAKFKQAGRLRDGRTQLTYEEEIEATAGDGDGIVQVPERFTIEVRPFYGARPVTLEARIRYRLVRGDLSIGYQLHRPDDVRRTSFATDVLEHVAGALKDRSIPVIEGQAAAPLRPAR